MIVFWRDHFRSFRRPERKSVTSSVPPLGSNPHHEAERCSLVLPGNLPAARRRDVYPDKHRGANIRSGRAGYCRGGQWFGGSIDSHAANTQLQNSRLTTPVVCVAPPENLLRVDAIGIGEATPCPVRREGRPERRRPIPGLATGRRAGIRGRGNELGLAREG